MVSTSLMVDTSSHPRAQLHRCVERSAYGKTASKPSSSHREIRAARNCAFSSSLVFRVVVTAAKKGIESWRGDFFLEPLRGIVWVILA